ncbi:hypothetical protein EC160509_04475 [Escherichia coli O145:H28]|nr:hypothetical protein EC160509_04475 [Escherichia coli O145:H28]
MLFILETARVIQLFILVALPVETGCIITVTGLPVGGFKGVIFGDDISRADLCAVTKAVDTLGECAAGLRIEGDRKCLRQADHAITKYQLLPGAFLGMFLIKKDAFLCNQSAEKLIVGFAVLHAKLPRRMHFIEQVCCISHPVIIKQPLNNALDILLLKMTKILP